MHSDLIAKLEALDGPDRDVDLKLTNIFDKHPDGWSYRWSELSLATNIKTLAAIDLPDGSEELYHQYLGDWGNGDAIISPKHYTASLDAAIALVERVLGEDIALELLSDVAESAKTDTVNGTLAGLPIALLIATLKALEARDG